MLDISKAFARIMHDALQHPQGPQWYRLQGCSLSSYFSILISNSIHSRLWIPVTPNMVDFIAKKPILYSNKQIKFYEKNIIFGKTLTWLFRFSLVEISSTTNRNWSHSYSELKTRLSVLLEAFFTPENHLSLCRSQIWQTSEYCSHI